MDNTYTTVRYRKPPRLIRTLFSPVAKAVLRSPLHGILSRQLLLITFTGRKSGKEFTTPILYKQEGEILWVRVGFSWWKNLLGGAAVRVLLRGKVYPATTEVLGEEGGLTTVEVHLTGEPTALSRSPL